MLGAGDKGVGVSQKVKRDFGQDLKGAGESLTALGGMRRLTTVHNASLKPSTNSHELKPQGVTWPLDKSEQLQGDSLQVG
jgi:hypothetical protein